MKSVVFDLFRFFEALCCKFQRQRGGKMALLRARPMAPVRTFKTEFKNTILDVLKGRGWEDVSESFVLACATNASCTATHWRRFYF